ncbi:MAG TPA: GGDEF domain-containing protein, partial [Thermoanaerobaculia bacterium]
RLKEPLGLQTVLLHYLHDRRELVTRPHLLSEREWKTLRAHAITDPLTGLFNRRFLAEMLSRQIDRASRSGEILSLLMMDLEGFKSINDRLGHLAGDRVLVRTAGGIRESLRPGDFACRWGGDEFVAVLPQVDLLGSFAVAERIRKKTSESTLPRSRGLKVGLYYGASTFPFDGKTLDELIHSADDRLYEFREQWHYDRGNRRQYPRFDPDWLDVRLRVGRERAPRDASILDVGYGGVAFQAENEEQLPTDGTAEIGRGESNRRPVRIRVTNEARLPDGGLRVGCSYE